MQLTTQSAEHLLIEKTRVLSGLYQQIYNSVRNYGFTAENHGYHKLMINQIVVKTTD